MNPAEARRIQTLLLKVLSTVEGMLQATDQAVSVGERLIEIIAQRRSPNPVQLLQYRDECAKARQLMAPAQQQIEVMRQQLGSAVRRH